MPTCLKWRKERHDECTATADQGYDECKESRDEGYEDCCDWAPCSWACDAWTWVSNIVCVAWNWVSNVVCVAWAEITTAVCVVWDVITTVLNAALVTLESILGWVLSAVAFIVEFFESIPVLGTLIRWVLNGITLIITVLITIPDFILGLLGIRPEKKLRVCTVVLKDESGNSIATIEQVIPLLQLAANIYKRDANVRLIPSRAFQYDTGFNEARTVDASWIIMDTETNYADTLDVRCNAGSDWLLSGTRFQLKSSNLCFFGSWRRVVGYGAPITCFIIRQVIGTEVGCSLFITDYITVDKDAIATSPRTIGHEIGHSTMLTHVCVDEDITNLMATQGDCDPTSATMPDRVNPVISNWQALKIRTSKHVSYF